MKACLFLVLFAILLRASTADEENVEYLPSWVVHLSEDFTDEQVKRLAEDLGFIHDSRVFKNDNIHVFKHSRVSKRSTSQSAGHQKLLSGHELIVEAEQEKLLVRKKRAHIAERPISETDSLWKDMWYLNRGVNSKQWDMNIIPAWNMGYTGKNIVVTILDDGIELKHPDLQQNYDPEASYDINSNDPDPTPRYEYSNENRHGTRCAGEVAAQANNSVCGVGVAPHAKIGGIRMLDGSVTDSVEARSLSFHQPHIDIYSASWGPDDNGRVVDGPGKLAKKAFLDGVTSGRNGKGNIFVWASGNGGNRGDSCSCDGYSNSMYTLSVSSASESNDAPWYLEQCASTLATTYSSGANFKQKQIVTTDLRGQCTTRHTGTSASAPLAAGLVAVMLEAKPELTWRDVQYCTLLAANPEPLLSSGQFTTNQMKRKVSHKFGYGLMDAAKMVSIAKTWISLPPQLRTALDDNHPNADMRDGKFRATVHVDPCTETTCIRYLEHVQIILTMSSANRGDLSVVLMSPGGTKSTVLPQRSQDRSSSAFTDWPFLSVFYFGENPEGSWTIEVSNNKQHSGKVSRYQLVLYGTNTDPLDRSRVSSGPIQCDKGCDKTKGCRGTRPQDCYECAENYYIILDTNTCVEKCPDEHYYVSEKKKTCLACDPSCLTCSSDGPTCDSCRAGLFHDFSLHCVDVCPAGQYTDKSANDCKVCMKNCLQCVHATHCRLCEEGYEFNKGKCRLNCKEQEYRNDDGECVPCDQNCVVCLGPGDCKACELTYKLYKGDCYSNCPNSTYLQYSRESSGECFDCSKNCESCDHGDENNCLTCKDGYTLIAMRECVSDVTCNYTEFKNFDGQCKPCHVNCSTCSGVMDYDCTSCQSGAYLLDGSCLPSCPQGFYEFISRDGHQSCQRCDRSCRKCNGSASTNCTLCWDDAHHLSESGQCVSKCPQGRFLREGVFADYTTLPSTEDTLCSECSSHCSDCSGPLDGDCTACKPDFIFSSGHCVAACESDFYVQESSRECQRCHPSCLQCSGPLQSDCTACSPGTFLTRNGQCVAPDCHRNQYFNWTVHECLQCYETCETCSGGLEIHCETCTTPLLLNSITNQCMVCCDSDDDLACCPCEYIEETKATICSQPSRLPPVTIPPQHKQLITISVICILGVLVLGAGIFVFLNFRTSLCARHGVRFTSDKIEYTRVQDDDGLSPKVAFSKMGPKTNLLDYGSD